MSDQIVQTVFKGIKSNFIKATIYSRDLTEFKALGFVEGVDFLPDDEVKRETLSLKEKPKGAAHESKRANT